MARNNQRPSAEELYECDVCGDCVHCELQTEDTGQCYIDGQRRVYLDDEACPFFDEP